MATSWPSRKVDSAKNGQIVVARIGEEVTVKRYRKTGDTIELLPENPDFKVITVDPQNDEFALEGLAVGLMRSWHCQQVVVSSMPTDTRISDSAMPMLARRSAPISKKIVCATGITSVRVSPRLLAGIAMLQAVQVVEAVDAVLQLEAQNSEP
jgi:hypothetical protein